MFVAEGIDILDQPRHARLRRTKIRISTYSQPFPQLIGFPLAYEPQSFSHSDGIRAGISRGRSSDAGVSPEGGRLFREITLAHFHGLHEQEISRSNNVRRHAKAFDSSCWSFRLAC
jgi:hypothetical protein